MINLGRHARASMLPRPGIRSWARWSGRAILSLHLLVVALAPHADARVDAASRSQQSHVEAPDRQACAPAHHHLYCQLCRAFTITGARSGGYRLELPADSDQLQPAAWPARVASRSVRSPSQPRAPPRS